MGLDKGQHEEDGYVFAEPVVPAKVSRRPLGDRKAAVDLFRCMPGKVNPFPNNGRIIL